MTEETNQPPEPVTALPAVTETNKDYMRYNSSGRIIALCSITQRVYEDMVASGVRLLEGTADPMTHYVVNGAVVARPECPATLNEMTITSLPLPCSIQIDASIYEVTEDHVDLSFDEEGPHKVRVICWPQQDKEFTVEAASQ